MFRPLLVFLTIVASPLSAPPPTPASIPASPRAAELFGSDWVLMNWALKFYDRDDDVRLWAAETQAATREFRTIADADGHGRATPREYREARAFILARY
jgi:hypothetical protein